MENSNGSCNIFDSREDDVDCVDEGLEEEMMEIYEEDLAVSTPRTQAEEQFDEIIGHIEDIIMDDNFQTLQASFMEQYYGEFEDAEENKFVYTDIHHNYVESLEHFLEQELIARVPNFSMPTFLSHLSRNRKELDGEIFEMLLTFTDFSAFKEMMVDYKNDKEGRGFDLGSGLCITPISR